MNDKDILKNLTKLNNCFRVLSNMYYERTNDSWRSESERGIYKGRSQVYAFVADRIDKLIEKDISKE